jgi:hypothetical protein
MLKYVEYLKENLQKVTEYAEYVAESVNKNLLVEDEGLTGTEADELKDDSKDVTTDVVDGDGKKYAKADARAEDDSKELEKDLEDTKAVDGENIGKEVTEAAGETGTKADELKDDSKDVTPDVVDIDGKKYAKADARAEDDSKELKKDLEDTKAVDGENIGKEVTEEVDRMDAYKAAITEKLQALVEKATAKTSKAPSFLKFISESKVQEFNGLAEEDKSKVLKVVEGKGFLTESQIYALWNQSLAGAPVENEPTVIAAMPAEYRETWNSLSESKKSQLLAQSKYHKLETEYQVRNFWQTRDLRETSPVMEKIEMIKESNEVEVNKLPYDLTNMKVSIAKQFKK